MKLKLALLAFLFPMFAFGSVTVFNSSDTRLGTYANIKCTSGLSCSAASGKLGLTVQGDGDDSMPGFVQNRILATATTLTIAQCGSTVYNGGAIAINLPEASTALGCRFTFITANASNFDVNPDDADQILVLTNAAGDSIRNATLGNSVTLEAISATQWAQVSAIGTYTDNN